MTTLHDSTLNDLVAASVIVIAALISIATLASVF